MKKGLILILALVSITLGSCMKDEEEVATYAAYVTYKASNGGYYLTDDNIILRAEIDAPTPSAEGDRFYFTFTKRTIYGANDWGVKVVTYEQLYVIDLVVFPEGGEDTYGNDPISSLYAFSGGEYLNFMATYTFLAQDNHTFTLLQTGYDATTNTIAFEFRHKDSDTGDAAYEMSEVVSVLVKDIVPDGQTSVNYTIKWYSTSGTYSTITGTYSK